MNFIILTETLKTVIISIEILGKNVKTLIKLEETNQELLNQICTNLEMVLHGLYGDEEEEESEEEGINNDKTKLN